MGVLRTCDIGVAEHDHVFIIAVFRVRVHEMLCRHVCGTELNVMMVAHDGEGAFKQRVYTISPNHYPRPSYMCPMTRMISRPRLSSEHLVRCPIYELCPHRQSIFVEILYRSTFRKDIVIWLQGQFDFLLTLVQSEMQVEGRMRVNAMRWSLDGGIFDEGQIFQRFSADRVC